jgi:hypothetical protein
MLYDFDSANAYIAIPGLIVGAHVENIVSGRCEFADHSLEFTGVAASSIYVDHFQPVGIGGRVGPRTSGRRDRHGVAFLVGKDETIRAVECADKKRQSPARIALEFKGVRNDRRQSH